MTTVYDPDLWLESLTRALSDFCGASLDDPDSDVEMSFPDTSTWTKTTPLARPVVHFEIDDISTPILGFGSPGRDVFDDANGTVVHQEVQQHDVNFDVGVWVSAETGGATKRMELVRKLKDMFTSATYKKILSEQYNGISVLLFDGGTNVLDRINDVPLWRTTGMTLIVRVFSRVVPPGDPNVPVVGSFDQDPHLVIDDNGTLSPVTTP